MNGDIAEDPLARSVLRHLATNRSADDPLGSFARTVLNGEATLQTAANDSWHSEGLATAISAAQDERARMTPEQLAAIEQAAVRLRDDPHAPADDAQTEDHP
jgi:hypothetical protein